MTYTQNLASCQIFKIKWLWQKLESYKLKPLKTAAKNVYFAFVITNAVVGFI